MKKIISLIVTVILLTSVPFQGNSQSWEKLYTGYNYIYRGIEFPGGQSQTGYAGGQSVTYYGNGIVVKTTDGGNTWSQIWYGTQLGVEGISFPTLHTGYICGWTQMIKKTTDAGLTWTDLTPTAPANVYYYTDIIFKDSLHGIVTAGLNGGFAAGIYATSDGGATWTPGTGMANEAPYKICYVTADTYFYVTNNGKIHKSTDGGLTWSVVGTGMGLLLGIDFYNSQIGIATSEDGLFYKTFDGGVTWQPQVTASGNPLWRATEWKNQNEIIMCGTPETVWKSTDGGATWANDYPASAYNGALYDLIYTPDDYWYMCGSQGYFYRKAPYLQAAFTSNATTICHGASVQFTDQSQGNPTSWSWSFPGGTPASSNLQNPAVTYSTPGVYDVTLTVFRQSINSTISMPGYITVENTLSSAPSQPIGPSPICGTFSYDYTTTAVAGAVSYTWNVTPASAGTINGNGLTGTLLASNNPGTFSIKVAGNNSCGIGPYSSTLDGSLNFQPNVYYLLTGGGYCIGDPGYEIQIDDSDLGVDYQLFKDGTASGAPVPGTGNMLSFGYQTEGSYTVSGASGNCSANMQGIAYVNIIEPPAAASQPSGPSTACEGSTSTFNAILPSNSVGLVWTLDPASSGTLTQPSALSASVIWTPGYSGQVSITVQGQNDCGTGASSPALVVTINPIPLPEVSGLTSVCKNQQVTYSTPMVTGSTYSWIVAGGSVESGQGTNEITILWNQTGSGTVSVNETTAENCTGLSPVLSVEVNECTGLQDPGINEFSISPNPAKDYLNLNPGLISQEPFAVYIYDLMGKVVYKACRINPSSQVSISLEHFVPGTYTIRIANNQKSASKTFVIE
jgi:PKD repeat protein